MLGHFGLSAVNAVQRAQNVVASKAVSFLSKCLVRCANSGTGKTVATGFTPSKASASGFAAEKNDNKEPLLVSWGSAGICSNTIFISPDFGSKMFSGKQVSVARKVSGDDSVLLKIKNFSMFECVKHNSSDIESSAAKPLTGILAKPKGPPVNYEGHETTEEPTLAVPKKEVSFANGGKPTAVYT